MHTKDCKCTYDITRNPGESWTPEAYEDHARGIHDDHPGTYCVICVNTLCTHCGFPKQYCVYPLINNPLKVRRRIIATLKDHPDITISMLTGAVRNYAPNWQEYLEIMVGLGEVERKPHIKYTHKGNPRTIYVYALADDYETVALQREIDAKSPWLYAG